MENFKRFEPRRQEMLDEGTSRTSNHVSSTIMADLLNFTESMIDITNTSIPPSSPTVFRNSATLDWYTRLYEWRFLLPFYAIILTLSVTGNCLVIATLAQNRRMRTVTNVYLLNLAISDLLLGVFCLPFTLVGQVLRRFIFGAGMCKLIPYLQAVTVSVAVWTLVAISLERYFAICRPLESRRWQTQCHAYKMIFLVWIVSLALATPILHVSTLQEMRQNLGAYKCREVWTSSELEKVFNLGIDAVLLLVPFVIMTAAYSLIVGKLWRGMRNEIRHSCTWQKQLQRSFSCKTVSTTRSNTTAAAQSSPLSDGAYVNVNGNTYLGPKEQDKCRETATLVTCGGCPCCRIEPQRQVVRSTHTDRSIEAKRKVIRMLFVIIAEFFVCWAPIHVVNTVYLFYPDALYAYIGRTGIAIVQLLAYCSSCCNPITYCFMNRKFRIAFLNLFKPCCHNESLTSINGQEYGPKTPSASAHENNDLNVCAPRNSHRTELDALTGEECV